MKKNSSAESGSRSRDKPPLAVLCGPTAAGKTGLSLLLAEHLNAEIISADSMQVYRHMDIGTDKIKPENAEGIPHHLIDIADPGQEYTVADFKQDAEAAIAEIVRRGHLPMMVGGTGLYIKATIDGFLFPGDFEPDWSLREELKDEADKKGRKFLHDRLQELDPQSAERIHPNDLRRVIRALEVYEKTGKKLSTFRRKAENRKPPYRLAMVGITDHRQQLYERINRRVDMMMDEGLLDEVKCLKAGGYAEGVIAMQALGYKELLDYLEGELTLDEAVEEIKTGTRRLAKRQLTWFKRDERIRWYNRSEYDDLCELAGEVESYIRSRLESQK